MQLYIEFRPIRGYKNGILVIEYFEVGLGEKFGGKIDLSLYISETVGLPTLKDIAKELEKPGLDPRAQVKVFNLRTINDLKIGMKVPGIINNITNFGCFVDIGVKESSLVHVFKVSAQFIINIINTVVHLNQQVEVTIIEVDIARKRIQLSMVN